MTTVYLSIGSNKGDRSANIDAALAAIGSMPDMVLEKVSSIIETKAEGFDGADFLNCCCSIETTLTPRQLLERLKKIEESHGRPAHKMEYDRNGQRVYTDRPIDIDILLYGDIEINEGDLQIPHPRMWEREFVMAPLNEIRNNQIL